MTMNNEIDIFEDLNKLSAWLYRNVNQNVKDSQTILENYAPAKKKVYSQQWSIYEKACSQEKLMFLKILKDAVDYLNIENSYKGNGRPPAYYDDIVKSICIKAYSNYSSWRAESDLKIARAMGIIDFVPRRSTLNKYMQNEMVTGMLHKLYKIIAEPLSLVEVYFCADATGIGKAYGNQHWIKVRHTKEEMKQARDYKKLHIVSGVKTNIICSAKITEGNRHESPYFKSLIDDTAKIFDVKEVSADAGYLSKDNVKAVSDIGAVPYIMPKKNVNVPSKGRASAWGGMLRLWKNYQMFFAEHYHKRSNVESTFSALKRKFGGFCRCKKPESQENEILAKIVCFNASVLAEALLSYDLRKGFLK